MYLALKRTPARNANWLQRAFSALTRWRLCSQYSHGGIVHEGWLYHSSIEGNGLTREPFDMEKAGEGWDFFDLGTGRDDEVLVIYSALAGTPYDWWGLLAFVLPWQFGRESHLYCFEACAIFAGHPITGRVTPEILMAEALRPS
ncbi:hypothetical protein [Brachymonas chironomi]|uniref:hypothetical protein n=1 Tax=Brachymonas chironomi TaxID=491919 RepID=UPI0003714C98|nr:hypothetical protein [Brachymonas chironomi]